MQLRQYLNSDFLATLPSELQTTIAEVKKISDTGYIDGLSGSLTSSNDKIWILSADEIGETSDSYSIIHGQGDVYPCFTDGESRMFSTTDGQRGSYWLRTSNYSNNMRFYNHDDLDDSLNSKLLTDEYYILIGFTLSRFVTASYTNAQFDKFINNRIEGAQVNRGLAEEDDEDYEDEEEEEERELKPWENGYASQDK